MNISPIKNSQKLFQISLLTLLLILTDATKTAFAKSYEVEMLNSSGKQSMLFQPAYLKLEVGDQVTFIPTDRGHNSQSVFVPKGAKKWKGRDNQKVSYSFTKEGIYVYECKNHTIMSMVGIIQVGEAVNLQELKKFINEYRQ
ncbi:MAG: pseudoazurin, partial [Proteobacteria bacterium]|nr:pseudoazurin [Pseudomonadota bacterium]